MDVLGHPGDLEVAKSLLILLDLCLLHIHVVAAGVDAGHTATVHTARVVARLHLLRLVGQHVHEGIRVLQTCQRRQSLNKLFKIHHCSVLIKSWSHIL